MKNYWKHLCCLLLLILVSGCLGHKVETSGDKYLREYGDLEFENERGVQNITFIVYGSSANETSSKQDVGAKQSSETDGKLGLNGGAVSEGAGAVATGLQTLDYLIKADTPDAVLPPGVPVVAPDDPEQKPPVKPAPPAKPSVYETRYHHTTTGSSDGGKSLVMCPGQVEKFDKCVAGGVIIPNHGFDTGREIYWHMTKVPLGDIVCEKNGKTYRYLAVEKFQTGSCDSDS